MAFAQKDSLKTKEEHDFSFVDRLDSLLLDWHKYYTKDSTNISHHFDLSANIITDLPDTVYRDRLAQIVSPIELPYNAIVLKHIKRYVTRGKWFVPNLLGKAQYYFPMFEEVLDAYQLPHELKYLTIVESALNPNAVSRAGATGIWQFMLATGRRYDLEVNSYVDERRDPYTESIAAARYLKDLYEMYNDWHLAIASYNCGPGNINKAIRRSGGKTNYWEIAKHLPNETRNYVPAFIAVNYIFNFYSEHGFKIQKANIPMQVDTMMITAELSFEKIANILEIEVEELRLLNPQYRKDYIPAKNKHYPLRLRSEITSKFISLEDSIYKIDTSLIEKHIPVIIEEYFTDTYTPAPQPANTDKIIYTVKSGDVLGYIASWYDVNISELKSWSGIYSNNLKIGQKITIYKPTASAAKYKKIDNMSFEAKQKMVGKSVAPSNTQSTNTALDANYEYYTVKKGDNPWTISKKFNNISIEEIMKLNNIENPSNLKVGQKIKIRKKA
ncbi:MAG: transglycosylase SLT domain-containing protein [Bacteroidales bacterium]|nr:transglycosylase SLT domain-containing protein [Bacteroidales bacterium]